MPDTHDFVDLDRLIFAFLATHQKKTTIDTYRQHLSGFRRWCDDRKLHLLDVNQVDLTRYFAKLAESLAAATIRARQGALRPFMLTPSRSACLKSLPWQRSSAREASGDLSQAGSLERTFYSY